jgi:mutator protein MutT
VNETIDTYDAIAGAFAERHFDTRLAGPMARFGDRLARGARVLDVGCGPGRDAAWLSELGFEALGVDLSYGMLHAGLERGVSVPLIQADMQRLPFRHGSFRGLWVCAALLHIPKAQAGSVLRELSRVVHPGHIYLSVKRGEGEAWVEGEDGGRRRFVYYYPDELQLLVERSGFEVLHCWESGDAEGRDLPWINLLAWSVLQTPRSGTCAIILNEAGEVLLTRRADNGAWCLPGGHMDFGETVEQCVVREAYEETGLAVAVERLVGVYSQPIPANEYVPQDRHYVIRSFLCRRTGGTIQVSDETTEVRYFTPHDLPEGLLSWHRQRIADAVAGEREPFIR